MRDGKRSDVGTNAQGTQSQPVENGALLRSNPQCMVEGRSLMIRDIMWRDQSTALVPRHGGGGLLRTVNGPSACGAVLAFLLLGLASACRGPRKATGASASEEWTDSARATMSAIGARQEEMREQLSRLISKVDSLRLALPQTQNRDALSREDMLRILAEDRELQRIPQVFQSIVQTVQDAAHSEVIPAGSINHCIRVLFEANRKANEARRRLTPLYAPPGASGNFAADLRVELDSVEKWTLSSLSVAIGGQASALVDLSRDVVFEGR